MTHRDRRTRKVIDLSLTPVGVRKQFNDIRELMRTATAELNVNFLREFENVAVTPEEVAFMRGAMFMLHRIGKLAERELASRSQNIEQRGGQQ